MIRRQPKRRALAAFLLLLCAAGAGLLALHRFQPDFLVERLDRPDYTGTGPEAVERAGASGPSTTPETVPPESRFAVVALRPLFSPDRRPPDKPAAPRSSSEAEKLPDMVLTGIVQAGEDSIAIIEPTRPQPGSEFPLTLRIGDTVGAWKVEAIEADRIVLTRGGARQELELKQDESRRRRQQPPQGQEPARRLRQPQVLRPAPPSRTE